MTKALMNGKPVILDDCIDSEVCIVQSDTDLKEVVSQLSGNDVVLVIRKNKKLQEIVIA